MGARTTPTLRQRRLGAELRKLRERAGLSARQASELLSADSGRISNTESGRFGISADRIRNFAYNYGCQDGALINALADMATKRTRHWWEEYREILPTSQLDLAQMEYHAHGLRSAQVIHLPGLLQTVDYARLVFRNNIPTPPPPHVEFLTSHRLKRQHVLFSDEPVPYSAVIHEAGLRTMFGDKRTTRDQLLHIVEMSELDHVTIRAMPFSAGLIPGSAQTVVLAEGPLQQLDTVQLDTEHGSEFLHAEAQLTKYRTLLDRTEGMALEPAASRDLIQSIARSL